MKRVGVVALMVMLGGVQGYEMWPKHYIHESMTLAAKQCFDVSVDRKPQRCEMRLPEHGGDADLTWIAKSSNYFVRLAGYGARYPRLGEAVRWPDDPTRQIAVLTLPRFGGTIQKRCGKLAAGRGGRVNNLGDGLLCNSHLGTMQFFHAQADTSDVPAVVTHDNIMGWAAFLYSVAALRTDAELDVPYCSVFPDTGSFNSAMVMSGRGERCALDWVQRWRLTDFFTLECVNPFSSRTCYVEKDESRHDKARIIATGALLHVIQDSYSQSHCARGTCGPGASGGIARVECSRIDMFTTYTEQSPRLHARADKVPTFAPSCQGSSDYDDPITASAKVLWHISKRSPPEEFLRDFERVFGTRAAVARETRPSGVGACFK
jgi:hypothetical protein